MTEAEIATAIRDWERQQEAANVMLNRAQELELGRMQVTGNEEVIPDVRVPASKADAAAIQDELIDNVFDKANPSIGGFMDEAPPRIPTFHEYQMLTAPSDKQKLYLDYLKNTADAYAKRRFYYGVRKPYRRGYRSKYRSYRRGGYGRRYKRRRYNRYRSGYGGYYDPDTQEWKKGFGPNYGSRLGSALGEGIQSFAEVIGLGEYKVKKNSLMANVDMGTDPPRVKNSMKGEATIIHHREYLGDLMTGPGAVSPFRISSYNLNIGNSLLFPFGSALAKNFQEWEPRGIIVELKSISSEYAANLSLGSMFMAVDYNSLDSAPVNKTELENLEYAVSQKPSKSCMMPVECAMANDVLTHLYVSLDGDYDGGDPRFSDLGKLHIGSYGIPNTGGLSSPIAEIWISYEIALFKPHIHNSNENLRTAYYSHWGFENADPLEIFGDTTAYNNVNPFGISLDNITATITIPAFPQVRTFYVRWCINLGNGTTYNVTSFTSATISGGSFQSQFVNYNDTLVAQARTPTAVAGQQLIERNWLVQTVPNSQTVIGFGSPAFVTSPAFSEVGGDLWIFLCSDQRITAV